MEIKILPFSFQSKKWWIFESFEISVSLWAVTRASLWIKFKIIPLYIFNPIYEFQSLVIFTTHTNKHKGSKSFLKTFLHLKPFLIIKKNWLGCRRRKVYLHNMLWNFISYIGIQNTSVVFLCIRGFTVDKSLLFFFLSSHSHQR